MYEWMNKLETDYSSPKSSNEWKRKLLPVSENNRNWRKPPADQRPHIAIANIVINLKLELNFDTLVYLQRPYGPPQRLK